MLILGTTDTITASRTAWKSFLEISPVCQVLCEAQGHREWGSSPLARPVLLGDHSPRGVIVAGVWAQGGLPRLWRSPEEFVHGDA